MPQGHWQQQIVADAGAKGVGRCDRDLIAHVVAEPGTALDMHSELAVVNPVSGMFETGEKPAIDLRAGRRMCRPERIPGS